MDIRNCKECGRLFNYVGRRFCPDCIKKQEDKFQEVKDFIRKNPNAGVAQVAKATDVTVGQIQHWIREERLILTMEAAADAILCESCGAPIRTGRYCEKCKKKVSKEMSQVIGTEVKQGPAGKKAEPAGKETLRFLDRNENPKT